MSVPLSLRVSVLSRAGPSAKDYVVAAMEEREEEGEGHTRRSTFVLPDRGLMMDADAFCTNRHRAVRSALHS